MHDDEMMDRLLRDAMAADVPQLSPAFDARVLRRVRPRRLTTMGRLVIAVYIVAAAATTLWLMRDLPTGVDRRGRRDRSTGGRRRGRLRPPSRGIVVSAFRRTS